MISFISGKLTEKAPNLAVVESGGIGYDLIISGNTYQTLPEEGAEVRLFTHLILSSQSDQMNLYGFGGKDERGLFRTLISISGIGAKGAIKILSGISPGRFREVIASEDVDFLATLPGIGKKSAQRLIVELREKLPAVTQKKDSVAGLAGAQAEEVVQALVTLGLSAQESRKAVERVVECIGAKEAGKLPAEELIRKALTLGR